MRTEEIQSFPKTNKYKIEFVQGYKKQKLKKWFLENLEKIQLHLTRSFPNDWGFTKMTSSKMSLGTQGTTILSEAWRQSEFREL